MHVTGMFTLAFDRGPGARQSTPMLLWSGVFLLLLGATCFAIDRRAVHLFHSAISQKRHRQIYRTTDWAKGGHWLAISSAAYLASLAAQAWGGPNAFWYQVGQIALAFLVSLAVGSAILHSMKILLGRRRPRDELELSLYGFRPGHIDLQYDSFPSGHSLTIFCVAVIASAVLPQLAPLWFVIAIYLSLTRALLNAHFLSDVAIGAGIGLVTAREIVVLFFPALAQPWF